MWTDSAIVFVDYTGQPPVSLKKFLIFSITLLDYLNGLAVPIIPGSHPE